jgi:subtilisin family serine protease
MNSSRYVLLRRPPPISDAFENIPEEAEASIEDLTVSEEQLTAAEAHAAARDDLIYCIARAAPMRLIRPVAKRPSKKPATPWGISAVGADRTDFTGDGVVVAVLDTGIDPAHPAFKGVTLVRENFTRDKSPDDEDGHGTHCAGTIFGRDVDGCRIGVARGVKRALIGKVIGRDGGDSAEIVRAIQWAVKEGAHVISMSLGFDPVGYFDTLIKDGYSRVAAFDTAMQDMLATKELFEAVGRSVEATRRDVVLVVAAGNESLRPKHAISATAPAGGRAEFITVGAIGAGQPYELAYFSNTGVDVMAPGVDISSAALGGGLEAMDGTSMATPHVAGIAALLLEKARKSNQNVKANLIRDRIRGMASLANFDPQSDPDDVGNGLAQAP